MSAVRNVVFDFGGVLVEWKPEEILRTYYTDSARRDVVRRDVLQHPDWLEMDRGHLSEAQAIDRFAARVRCPREEMAGLMQLVRESLRPKAGTIEILDHLAADGVPLYALSNMSVEVFSWLHARYDFFGRFNGIVISAAVRLAKPDPAIFEHLATSLDITPAESLFIDDMAANVAAARGVGFAAVQFTSADALAAELVGRGLLA